MIEHEEKLLRALVVALATSVRKSVRDRDAVQEIVLGISTDVNGILIHVRHELASAETSPELQHGLPLGFPRNERPLTAKAIEHLMESFFGSMIKCIGIHVSTRKSKTIVASFDRQIPEWILNMLPIRYIRASEGWIRVFQPPLYKASLKPERERHEDHD